MLQFMQLQSVRHDLATEQQQQPVLEGRNTSNLTSGSASRNKELVLYKNPDNHNGVVSHLEPDILECEVKWALESITTKPQSSRQYGTGTKTEIQINGIE